MTCISLMHVCCHYHKADDKFSLIAEPACDEGRSYTIRSGDICNSIGALNNAPTLVSPYKTFSHSTYAVKYSYQIICQNELVNGGCTNLGPDKVKLVFRILLGTF